MRYNKVTLDAYTLIWYIHEESNSRLSQVALMAISDAEKSGIIYIPAVVLLEVLSLLEKRKYPISFDSLLQAIEENEAYEVIPLTKEVINILKNIRGLELHDRVIVAFRIDN